MNENQKWRWEKPAPSSVSVKVAPYWDSSGSTRAGVSIRAEEGAREAKMVLTVSEALSLVKLLVDAVQEASQAEES